MLELVLIEFGHLVHARCQQIGGAAAAHFKLLDDGFGAADQQLLQLADPAVERVGDFQGAFAERRVDFCDPLADRIGELGGARVDKRGDLADAPVDGGGDLLAAVGERLGDIGDAGRQCIGEALRAAVERFLETSQTLIERGGDFIRLGGDAVVEAVDIGAHRLGDVLSAGAEPLDQLGAVGLHRPIEFGEMPGDEVAERRGIPRDPFAELGAGVIEHVLERGKACDQHFLDGVIAGGDDAGDVLGAFANLVGRRGAVRSQHFGDAVAGLLQLAGHVRAAQIEIDEKRFARRLERAVDLLDAHRNRLGDLPGSLDDGVGEFLRSAGNQVDHRKRFLGEGFGDPVEPGRHHVLKAGGDFGELLADVVGLEIEARAEPVAGRTDRPRRLLARGLQPVEQVAAAVAELLDHAVADLAKRKGDVFAAFRQRMRDALRRFIDLLSDQIADRGKILREIDVHVVDGGTDLLGLSDQGVALAGHVLQQPANSHLIVAIGAFERGDLVLHQRFELAGACQCAFHAVAHGRDLAPDGLTDGDDGIPRHALGFGKPHRHPRHRLGDEPQFLRPPCHVRHAEEENDRQQCSGAKPDHERDRRVARAQRGIDVGQISKRQRQTADDPGAGERGCDEIGRARRPPLQGVQDLADRLLIVVGRTAGLTGKIPRSDGLGAEQVVLSGRGRGARAGGLGRAGQEVRHGSGHGSRHRLRAAPRLLFVLPNVECFLDRRQRRLGRVRHLLRIVGHFGRRLACYA